MADHPIACLRLVALVHFRCQMAADCFRDRPEISDEIAVQQTPDSGLSHSRQQVVSTLTRAQQVESKTGELLRESCAGRLESS